jgi:hypothetical protein
MSQGRAIEGKWSENIVPLDASQTLDHGAESDGSTDAEFNGDELIAG